MAAVPSSPMAPPLILLWVSGGGRAPRLCVEATHSTVATPRRMARPAASARAPVGLSRTARPEKLQQGSVTRCWGRREQAHVPHTGKECSSADEEAQDFHLQVVKLLLVDHNLLALAVVKRGAQRAQAPAVPQPNACVGLEVCELVA